MSKSEKPLPIRQSDDGRWEVSDSSDNWIKCKTKEDAAILSNGPMVLGEFYKTSLPNKEISAKLEKTAEKQEQYNMLSTAQFFRSMAKRARGKSS
jgi:hypothetical protein